MQRERQGMRVLFGTVNTTTAELPASVQTTVSDWRRSSESGG